MTSRRPHRLRAAIGRRVRGRLGIVELAARMNALNREFGKQNRELAKQARELRKQNRELGKLTKRTADVRPRLTAAEREVQRWRKRSESVQQRLGVAERELEVWRYMAWLERARPASQRLVSVITPTRNRADALERCIGSVLAQAHTRFELLVIDDGSEDATPDVLARYSDPRVRSVRIDHAGVCGARNRGLERARGSVITYLDDDNLMDPLWLMAVANAFDRHPEISVLYGARLIDNWHPKTEHPDPPQTDRGQDRPGPALRRLLAGRPKLSFPPFDRARLKRSGLLDINVVAHLRDHPAARFDEDLSSYGDRDLIVRVTDGSAPFELSAIACIYSTRAAARLSDGDRADELARVLAKHDVAEDEE
ncbi:MAG TPA: glycosyltransferase [Solirubrobacterales bacterium]|jgi:hypothetical protein|nr:glycosyltransferase [Solirubrobacterales bacterium]